jgi:hypothetical protein
MPKRGPRVFFASIVLLLASASVRGGDERFVRGDANGDTNVNIADAVFVLGYLFAHGKTPACPDAADVNDDGKLDISDAVKCLGFLFSGQIIPAPSPGCGADPTSDALGACTYSSPACTVTREDLAWTALRAFVNSFLDGSARPDAALFATTFAFDGYNRAQYIDALWTADDAGASAIEGGVQLVYRVNDSSSYVYDMLPERVRVPEDAALPVGTELALTGALLTGDLFSAFCESRAMFLVGEAGGAMQIVAPGPRWESQLADPAPAPFAFGASALRIDGAEVYGGTTTLDFEVLSLARAAGASLSVEVDSAALYGTTSGVLVDVRIGSRLFAASSPAATLFASHDDIALTQTSTGQGAAAAPAPALAGSLVLPSDLAAGWYGLVITVETLSGTTVYSTERFTFPLQVGM